MRRLRHLILTAGTLAMILLGGTVGIPRADALREASAAAGQTLFGLDVPSLRQLDDSESVLGARAAVVGTFADWAHTPEFPSRFATGASARGAVALISWEPWDSWRGGVDQPRYALRRITAGDYDTLIDRWAAEIARYAHLVMIRFAPEMNGGWLPWSTGVNGNRPGDYVAAWRHVRARFRRAGADNAVWVWDPIAGYDGATPLRSLFPGQNQVDWVAVDGYNWGTVRTWRWQSYADIFGPTVRELRALAPGRPVMIAETGCAPDPRRPAWVADSLASAHADGIGAVVWFEFAKEVDWRLASDPATARAARGVLKSRGWRQGGGLSAVERLVSGGGGTGHSR